MRISPASRHGHSNNRLFSPLAWRSSRSLPRHPRSTKGHPRAAPAEGPIEPDALRVSRRAGPSRPPARHAPRIPSPAASLRPRAASVSRRFAPPRPGRAASAEVHFGGPESAMSLAAQRRGGGPPASGARTARPAVEQVATVTARGCRERTAYGSAASASRPREQLKARHAVCVERQPSRPACLQRWRLSARHSKPWQCGCSTPQPPARAHDGDEGEDAEKETDEGSG